MRLKIENVAKVKYADIAMDGVTVIVGNNNTGKTTIGKVIYSIFNSLHDLDVKIGNKREDEIKLISNRYIRNMISHNSNITITGSNHTTTQRLVERIPRKLAKEIIDSDTHSLNIETYEQIFNKVCMQYGVKLSDEQIKDYIDATYEPIIVRMNNDNDKIALELIQRFFLQVFGSQIQCLKEPEATSVITLTIKGKDIVIKFKENKCIDWSADYNILNEAFLLDDPFVLDDVSNYFYELVGAKGIRGQLVSRLRESEEDIMGGLFDAVNAKDNLADIYNILNKVTQGDILLQNSQWGLTSEQFGESVNFENLSAGLKAFVLIKMLLEKGILKEKDVLILDEPEIHLHPEWQLYYAEIIVLLQKKFNLNILVTTHSSHFLEAIEFYSKKHGLSENCKYYLAKMDNGLAVFENVTGSLNKIYRNMITPSMLLDELKYDLENKDE